ncbi:MAG TPA: hypothetical protein VGO59_10920 [Verrucomicrobiae bacterium]
MKKLLLIALTGAALFLARPLHAQYSINWHTIGGGGGSSSGSGGGTTYTISGTIGQPATATMSGNGYSITGGFWSLLAAVQSPNSPLLSIIRSGNQAIVSWTGPATGFVLQQSSTLLSNAWGNSAATLVTNGSTISATVPAGAGFQYFRLVNP